MMTNRIRNGFTFSIPKKIIARLDIERGLATRSAYLSDILASLYDMKVERNFPRCLKGLTAPGNEEINQSAMEPIRP
jgi:hypothetical protein